MEKVTDLINQIREIGTNYPKISTYRHTNQPAATVLSKLCIKAVSELIREEIPLREFLLQMELLRELEKIFKGITTSANITKQVRDKLKEYPPFKNFDSYLPKNANPASPTPKDMELACRDLFKDVNQEYQLQNAKLNVKSMGMKP